MTHGHRHHRDGEQEHQHEAVLADVLDLDAEMLGTYLDDVTDWAGQHLREVPRTVVDVGAGTGAGSLALARHFPAAEVIAIDRSAWMLGRLGAAAREHGLADRLRVVRADLDVEWPAVGSVDVAWASSSLHEVGDPDRVLRDVHRALSPGGLLVVIEMDSLPRFLPDDVGRGRPGLEARCHDAMAEAGWNSHPDWRPHLELAGLEFVAQRTFTVEARPAPATIERYARAFLTRMRAALGKQLDADDLDTLDRLLADDALLRRPGLTVRGSRTAWAARRPRARRSIE